MEEIMRKIMSDEELNRISVQDEMITVDVHYMTRKQVLRFLRNIEVIDKFNLPIEIIHGYTHGTSLLELIRLEDSVFRKGHRIKSNPCNNGRTYIEFI